MVIKKISRLSLITQSADCLYRDVRLEHLWLVVLLRGLSWTVATWTSWASVVTTWSSWTSVIAAWTTVTLLTAWTSVSAWLALWLNVSLRLLEESLARESHLACLLIDLEELDVYLVTDLEDILYLLGLLPSDLRYVEEAFLTREDLYECTELEDRNDL